jgi:chemotaxis protein methyltransferase CheR
MPISANDFDYIRKLVKERSAIVLDAGKEYLVESRLFPLLHQGGFASIEELIGKLRAQSFNCLHQKVIEAMTTNETSFFRDLHPFEALKQVVLPDLIKKRAVEKTLNLWCAASSSGQEPYSMVMLLRESFASLFASWAVKYIASDISQDMLFRCREGIYTQLEINRGLPAAYLVKYFQRMGMQWQIKEDLRKSIDFREINLANPWPNMPRMDIVMMRNVLIYFDVETKKNILGKVRQLLKPDGYLFLGAAETTLNLDEAFERVQFAQSGCYRLRGA